jgi:hypothetical protein
MGPHPARRYTRSSTVAANHIGCLARLRQTCVFDPKNAKHLTVNPYSSLIAMLDAWLNIVEEERSYSAPVSVEDQTCF